MSRISVYESTDGSFHKSFELFAIHEERLRIKKATDDAVLDFNTFFTNEDAGSDEKVLSEDGIADFIADNAAALRKILDTSAITKRGRKAA